MGLSTSAPTLAPMAAPTKSRLVNFAREFPGMRTSLRWSSILSRLVTERQRPVLGGGPGNGIHGLHRVAPENGVPESERRSSGWVVGKPEVILGPQFVGWLGCQRLYIPPDHRKLTHHPNISDYGAFVISVVSPVW